MTPKWRSGDPGDRARTSVLLTYVRWPAVLVSLGQALIVLHQDARWEGLGLTSAILLYNLGATLAPRLGARLAAWYQAVPIAGDFAVATGWTLLTAGDPASLSYTFFALVGMEAAFVFGRLGAALAVAGYLAVLGPLTALHVPAFGGSVEVGLVYRAGIVVLPTAFAAAIAEHLAVERARLRAAEEQTRTILESAISAVITADAEGRVTGWNRRAELMFGRRAADVLSQPLADVILPDGRGPDWRRQGEGGVVQLTGVRRSGEEFPIELSASEARTPAGERQYVVFAQDVGFRRRTEALQAARYAVTYAINQAYSLEDGVPGVLQGVCLAMSWSIGTLWLVDEGAGGLRYEALWHADSLSGTDLEEASRALVLRPGEGLPGKALAAGGAVTVADLDSEGGARDGELVAEGLRAGLAFPVRHGADLLGVLEFYMHAEQVVDDETMVAMADIGVQVGQWLEREGIRVRLRAEEEARRAAEERARRALEFRAFHDLLTGLPNRQLFSDRLGQALALAKREQRRLAVMILDVDRFKAVNDRFGHFAGDLVLEEVAHRLRRALRSSDTAARIGGDEFAILPGGDVDAEAVDQIAEHVRVAFASEPWIVQGVEVDLGVSIGCAFYPEDGEEAGVLLEVADRAMYEAKRAAAAPAPKADAGA